MEKPSGLPTMPKDGADAAALACRLAARYPELTGVGPPLEAGLVHRLDAETSGLLVAARSEADRQALRFLWKWRRVDKEYLALVHGAVSRSFTVLLAIGHHPKSARRMVLSPGGMSAESRVRPLCRGKNWSLVAVSLREGRRHQIRVHLAESGYAVAGDPLYGNGPAKDSVPRLMLHASRLGFRIDPSSEAVRFYSRPPEDFVSSVNRKLRGRVEEAMDQYFRDDSPGRRS